MDPSTFQDVVESNLQKNKDLSNKQRNLYSEEQTQNDQLPPITGFSTMASGDTTQLASAPSFDPNAPSDVQKAEQDIGDGTYSGYCESFVEQMTGSGQMGGSAIEAWNNNAQAGRAVSGTDGIQPGDPIYFSANQGNGGYGHVGIYMGNNQFISATYNGTQVENLDDWTKSTGQQILGYLPFSNTKGGSN